MLDKKLVHAIKRGDEKAFKVMYELYFFKVINYARKLLYSEEDTRETAQDVFVKLWAKRYEIDPDQSISGLIFRITKCLCIDRIRMQAGNVKPSGISMAFEVAERSLEIEYLSKELHSVYQEIVNKLPEKRRLIFHLSRNEDLSHREIAQKLNISIKTVETQIRLGLQQIREDIRKY